MSERALPARGWLPRVLGLALIASLASCQDNPYSAETWTKKLGETHERERAVQELEQLGDPSAIEALGNAWEKQGKPGRWLQVIISLARPLTSAEADKNNFTDFVAAGRPEHWQAALPFLKKALGEVDENSQASIDGAVKAAEALGEAKLPDGLDALIEFVRRPDNAKLIRAHIGALRAIGKHGGERAKAADVLIKVIDREPPPHPRTATAKDQNRAQLEDAYRYYLGRTGAAINALAELHAPAAAKSLVMVMFRAPDLFPLTRRALVAAGPTAADELRSVLAGKHAEVNKLFKDKKLDKYCGDRNEAPPEQCQTVSARTFYPAVVLGDFYDAKAVPELLEALKDPPAPVAFADDQPSPSTQHSAIFDALRKIGAAEAAPTVRAMWAARAEPVRPTRGARAVTPPAEADLNTRIMAIGTYAFVARDDAGVEELGKIAADNGADAGLRQEAALAFARLSRDAKDIAVLQGLAQKYREAYAKKRAEADKLKPTADAADAEFEKAKKVVEAAKANSLRISHDSANRSTEEIKAAAAAATKADDDLKNVAKKTHRDAVAPYKAADLLAKQYKGYQRMFETHIARIVVALHCKQDLKCYAGALKLTPDQAASDLAQYVKEAKDAKQWTADDRTGLVEATIERAMLELGKAGAKASAYTETLLDAAKSDDRIIRQSILLALPKIAALPCKTCEAKLQAAIAAGAGKSTLADLNLETTMMKNYFGWAGGNTPSSGAADELPVPTVSAPPAKKK
jgi:hypothetical protein